jgi:hypothetical protein
MYSHSGVLTGLLNIGSGQDEGSRGKEYCPLLWVGEVLGDICGHTCKLLTLQTCTQPLPRGICTIETPTMAATHTVS